IRISAINKFARIEILNSLHNLIGYGGLIHHYKNYIVRGDPKYLQLFMDAHEQSQILLSQFRQLPGLAKSDQDYINQINNTFNEYAAQIELARKMHLAGHPIIEIDRAVKVDDSKALDAILQLKQNITQQDAGAWWRLATKRINTIYATEQAILDEMHQLSTAHYQASLHNLQLYAGLMVLTLFISIFFTYILSRRVIIDVAEMAEQVQHMMHSRDYTKKLPTLYNDEISDLANAFNELISEKNHYEAQIWKQANHDQLTGLPNRHFYMTLLTNALTLAQRNKSGVSILFLDLDHFKQVNDTLGHDAGDELLVKASQRIGNHLREADILARQGGDEFILILPETQDTSEAERIARLILMELNQPFTLQGSNEVFISTSIGIAVYPQDGANLEDLIRNADTAMYSAKANGKNTYCFYSPAMNEAIERRNQIETELKIAIREEQLELYYQPILNTKTDKIIGVEALIRWKHPERGMIYPDEFITIAEESNLIIEIGTWVVEAAVQAISSFNLHHNCHIELSINVSSKQCLDYFKFITKHIQAISKRYQFDLELLHIEITESILMDSSDKMITAMQAISKLGVQFHLDDFGTGYSSLSYLKKFPMDLIKIDRSFLTDLPQNKEDTQLVQTIINMAEGLHLGVIAEGVETQLQLDMVKEMGCHLIQGYYLTPPIQFKPCMALIEKHNGLTPSDF
ncbi:MAG: EAL domain-containing protein, partial [Gammaproteobacteria bacterium]|nr:EAL domain-containing protein [Gammaproteobacteria bacterium]